MQRGIVRWVLFFLPTLGFSAGAAAQSPNHLPSDRLEITLKEVPARCQLNPADRSPQDRGLEFNMRHLELCRLENNTDAVRSLLRVVGIVHQNEVRPGEARKAYLEALGISKKTPQRVEMLDSLLSLCLDHEAIGNPAQATQCREENLQTSEGSGDKRMYARALRDFGDYYRSQYDSATAMKYYDREMQVYVALDDKVGIGSTLRNIGLMYHTQRNISLAMDYYKSSVSVAKELGDKGELGDAVGSVCVLHRSHGYYQKAIDCLLGEALPLYKAVDDKAEMAGIYINVARAYQALKDYPTALDYYERSVKLREEAGLFWKVAETLTFATGVHFEKKDITAVRESHARSIEALKKEPTTRANIRRLISALNNIGFDRTRFRSDAERLEYFHTSLRLCEMYGERGLHAQTLRLLSQFYSERRDYEKSLKYSQEADKLETPLNLSITWRSSLAAAQAHVAKNEREKALPYYEETLKRIENAAQSNTQIIVGPYFETFLNRYTNEYILALMVLHWQQPSRGFDRKAFEVNERSKARFFRRDLDESAVKITKGVDAALLERERKLRLELNAKEEYLARDPKADVDAVKLQINQLTLGLQNLTSQIRKASPENRGLVPTSPLDVSEVQQEFLDDDTALVEYSLGNVWCFWVVTKSSFKTFRIRVDRSLDKDARRLHELLSDRKNWNEGTSTEYQQVTNRLAQELIAPAYETLKGKKLVIVADGALHYIPFGVLPVPDQKTGTASADARLLVEDHEIISVPSASVVSVLRRQTAGRKPAPKQLALFADPVFQADDERIAGTLSQSKYARPKIDDAYSGSRSLAENMLTRDVSPGKTAKIPRLPFSRREVDAIYETASKEGSLKAVDFDASFENAMSGKMSQYRIIHFATHGFLHSEYPELSGIVLSLYDSTGVSIKGFLRLNEIYKMRLNAELVVLSACQTALGKEVRGEGLIGLTRGFMYAGSPRVVASLWKVDDVATAELMKIFYQKMLKEKMRPAAALRAAKIAMMKQKRWAAPYYWAAFELQGEWR